MGIKMKLRLTIHYIWKVKDQVIAGLLEIKIGPQSRVEGSQLLGEGIRRSVTETVSLKLIRTSGRDRSHTPKSRREAGQGLEEGRKAGRAGPLKGVIGLKWRRRERIGLVESRRRQTQEKEEVDSRLKMK